MDTRMINMMGQEEGAQWYSSKHPDRPACALQLLPASNTPDQVLIGVHTLHVGVCTTRMK
eukprot:91965-Pelagomonas_calceolata.AAC.1